MKNHVFSGFSVAVVTPFNSDFSIDKESYANHLHFLLDNGVDHLVISGTTGESPSFSDDEFVYRSSFAVGVNLAPIFDFWGIPVYLKKFM